MIEWLPAQFTGGVKAVDVKARSVLTAGDTFKAAVANVIPAQTAGDLARQTGLADKSGWCPVDPVTFESTLQPGIHLVGDAIIGGDMPKSAFSANSQAKACAFAIAAASRDRRSSRRTCSIHATRFSPPTMPSATRSISSPTRASSRRSTPSSARSGKAPKSAAARHDEAVGWYAAFTRDVFGSKARSIRSSAEPAVGERRRQDGSCPAPARAVAQEQEREQDQAGATGAAN